MNIEQERIVRSWLANRDPGDAPARLRAVTAAVADAAPRSPVATLDAALWRVLGPSRWTRLILILVVVLAMVAAVVGAVVLRPWDPFPPRGLIAYTVPLEVTGSTGILVIAADGTGGRAVSPPASNVFDHSPRWSADGRTLLFARNADLDPFGSCPGVGSIVLYDVATATERVVATDLRPIDSVEWTAAGDQVAFLWPPAGCGAPGELGLVDLATGKVTTSQLGEGTWRLGRTGAPISTKDNPAIDPGAPGQDAPTSRWDVSSNDGHSLATLTLPGIASAPARNPASRLVVVSAGTGPRVDLGAGGLPAWSPDGAMIAFVQIVDLPSEFGLTFRDRLAVVATATWQVRTLADVMDPDTANAGGATPMPQLFWTQDGRAIYWVDVEGGHIVEVETGRRVDLPAAVAGCDELQWQPVPS